MSNLPTKCPDYLEFERDVRLVNDIFHGSKSAAQYLQQFLREDKTDFENRQKIATIDNFVLRTCESVKNIIFRKQIDLSNVTNTELLQWLEEDIDLKGTNAEEFAKKLTVNIVKDGYTFILVDSPKIPEDVVTARDEKESKIRPYLTNINRRDLTYWEVDTFGNYKTIVFNESYQVKTGLFGLETRVQEKAMFNDGTTIIYRDGAIFDNFVREVKEIALIKIDDKEIPPLLDMAKLNIEQLNRKSEKGNYVRIAGAPFLAVFGSVDEGIKTLSITQGIKFNSKAENDIKWVEMTGSNFNIIKEEIDQLNLEMENISISFATDINVKTATQVNADKTEDESKLTDYANKVEAGLNKAIEKMGLFRNNFNTENQYVNLNKDYNSNIMSPEQFNILMQLRLNGDLSYEMLISLLEKGEILDYMDEKAKATEKMRLLNEGVVGDNDL